MPLPTFGARGVVVDAVAFAIREAWTVPDRAVRPRVVQSALRRILGDEMALRILTEALTLLAIQPEAPAGDVEPPTLAAIDLCVRCRSVKLREERHVYSSKARMVFLRDERWMRRQFEARRRTEEDVAKEIGCCVGSVRLWRNRHEIDPPKAQRPWMNEAVLRRLLLDRHMAPGEAASELGCEVHTIRHWARRLGVVVGKSLWAHCTREWWVERVRLGMSQYAMARAAGIVTHATLYHLRKWGLWTKRAPYEAARLRKPKFARLYEPGWLRAQLQGKTNGARRRGFAAIARRVGCSQTAVKAAALKLGVLERTGAPPTPWSRDPNWYRERFAGRATVEVLAAEAGIAPKSIQNYIGQLGLADEYWQAVARWQPENLERTRRRRVAKALAT